MAEKEQTIRLKNNKSITRTINFIEVFGSISTTIVIIAAIVIGAVLILNDKEATGRPLIRGFLIKGLSYGIRFLTQKKDPDSDKKD